MENNPIQKSDSSPKRVLEGEGLKVHYGGVKAVDGVDIELLEGELLGLIGPNGAGKSTLVNALTKMTHLTAGEISVAGTQATKWKPDNFARNGVIRTFQNPRLYKGLTVLENIEAAALLHGGRRRAVKSFATELVDRVGMSERADTQAGALAYGQERMLSIARALAGKPVFLLLDEPAAGLSDSETEVLTATIGAIRDDFGCGVLVIEHDMSLIMTLCERIHVLDHGQTLMTGTPAEVRSSPRVIEAYLGKSAAEEILEESDGA
jgi:branched-chain amino acid transport system ATP-binding protein